MSIQTVTDLGQRIDSLRAERGMTVVELSALTRIPLTTLQRRLAGDDRITVSELRAISSALNVATAHWFEVAA